MAQSTSKLPSSKSSKHSSCTLTAQKTHINGETVHLCEFIKDRLYFVTLSSIREPKDCVDTHYFSIDNELVYQNYLADFGPLNISNLSKYFSKVRQKLNFTPIIQRIVHYTSSDPRKRVNAAFLIGCFAVVYLDSTPKEAYQRLLVGNTTKPFIPFQDAASANSCYQLRLLECLEGLQKAHLRGFVRFDDFDTREYDFFSSFKQGDLNWIVPAKILAHSGPVMQGASTPYKPPSFYVTYFGQNNVTTIVRLNKKAYDARIFTRAGIDHQELFFEDGSCPSEDILKAFLIICETAKGAVAVHCKAGLGRTGSLIGAYLMKHYRMNAKEAIAWMRIVRPGCVIGRQQTWLEDHEEEMWVAGDAFRVNNFGSPSRLPQHTYGVYSGLAKLNADAADVPGDSDAMRPATTSAAAASLSVAGSSMTVANKATSHGGSRSATYQGQKNRKHAFVSAKVTTTSGKKPKEEEEEEEVVIEKREGETQGDELVRMKAKWSGKLPPK